MKQRFFNNKKSSIFTFQEPAKPKSSLWKFIISFIAFPFVILFSILHFPFIFANKAGVSLKPFVAFLGIAVITAITVPLVSSYISTDKPPPKVAEQTTQAVLGAAIEPPLQGNIAFNIPAIFNDDVTLNKGITVDGTTTLNGDVVVKGKSLTLANGTITASNVIYGITPGSGLSIGTGQNPTVTNTGVLSVQGSTGSVTFSAGSGISVSGTTITNSDTGTAQNIFKNIIIGSSTIAASSNTDSLTFVAGTGVTLAADTTNKKVTIASTGGLSGLTTYGVLYANGSTTATSLTPGTAGYVLSSNGISAAPSWISTSSFGGVFQENKGVVSPLNITDDFTLGGISTVSAKFAFINNASGTPTASISGVLSLDANGTVQTTNNKQLALGGSTTGSIFLTPDSTTGLFVNYAGSVGIGTILPTAVLDVAGAASVSGSLSFRTGAGTIQTTANNGLIIGGSTTGNITLSPLNSTGLVILNGALRITQGSSAVDTFTTPQNSSVTTKINIPLYDPGAYNQIIAFGLPSSANSASRVLSLFDARGATHQPTLAIFTPDEQNVGGLSWEGSNGDLSIKNSASGGNLYLNINSTNDVGFSLATGITLFKGYGYSGSTTNTLFIGAGGSSPNAASFAWGDGTGWKLNFGNTKGGTYNPVISFDDRGMVGINTTSQLAPLDVRALNFTTPVASISGATGLATLVLDNSGSGDILTASASGKTRFVVTQVGNVGIGTATPQAPLDITMPGTGSYLIHSSTAFNVNQYGNIQSGVYATATNTNFLCVSSCGSTALQMSGNIIDGPYNSVNGTSPLATLDLRAYQFTSPVASISGATGLATLVLDNSGSGDIFTASASGATRFVVTQAGNVGIGTAIPTSALTVIGSGTYTNGSGSTVGSATTINTGNTNTKGLVLVGSLTKSSISSSGMVAYYKFDENSGLTVGDSISSINGTWQGTLGSQWITGQVNSGGNFNGTDNYVSISNNSNQDQYPISVAFWVKTSLNNATQTAVVSKYVTGSGNGYKIFMLNGHIYGAYLKDSSNYVYNSGAGTGADGGVINDGAWHHITFTVDATGGHIYTDGTFKNTMAWTGTPGVTTQTQSLYIGKLDTAYFPGGVDELAIWNRALSSTEVSNIYNSQKGTAQGANLQEWQNSSGTVLSAVSGSGFLGLGTSLPSYPLDLQYDNVATAAAQIFNTDTSANSGGLLLKLGFTGNGTAPGSQTTGNNFIRFLNGNGVAQGSIDSNGSGGVTYATTGIDFAEYFKKDNSLENLPAGTIVCQGITGVTACLSNSHIIGVISNQAGFVGGTEHTNDPSYVLVGLVGQLPIKMASGAVILSGDHVTTNAQGEAIKATNAGETIGIALQSSSMSANEAILVAVNASWYDPSFISQITQGSLGASTASSLLPSLQNISLFATDSAIISGTLNVLGRTTLTDVGVTGDIASGVLTIHGLTGEINTLSGDLSLQSEGLGGINILNGLVTIDMQGNITTKAVLSAQTIKAQQFVVSGGQSTGTATISAGLTSTTISTNVVTPTSKIFLTLNTITGKQLIVTQKKQGQFTVSIANADTKDIYFDWLVIGTQ